MSNQVATHFGIIVEYPDRKFVSVFRDPGSGLVCCIPSADLFDIHKINEASDLFLEHENKIPDENN